jgi:signal transduction histidine kinase
MYVLGACISIAAPSAAGLASAASSPDRYQPLAGMHHTAWTAKDGLAGEPFALAQTQDGYLWVGTSNGLYRFDGVSFEHFDPDGSALPATSVESLLATREGGLWVGFTRGGATLLGPDGRATTYTTAEGLPVGVVRNFAQDLDGTIWVAATGGLARLEAGRWRSVRDDWGYPCRSAWRLLVERDGTLWVGAASPDRVLYLPRGARRFHDTGLTLMISGFAQIADGAVVASDDRELVLYEIRRTGAGSVRSRVIVAHGGLNAALDRDGGLWLTGYDVSRVRLSLATHTPVRDDAPIVERFTSAQGLTGRVAKFVLIDREGTTWAITENGLDRFRRRNVAWRPLTFESYPSLIADRRGDVFLVKKPDPLLVRPFDETAVAGAPTSTGGAVGGFADTDGSLWLLTGGAMQRWDDGRAEPVAPPDEVVTRGYQFSVMAGARDRAGRLWAAVNGLGLFHRDGERWTFLPVLPGRPDMTPSEVHVDDANRVWLAYREELAMVDGGRVQRYASDRGLTVGPILAIASRSQDVLIGGEGGLAWGRGDRFHTVRTTPALDLGAVGGIVATSHGVWLSTAIGIVHVPQAELDRLALAPATPVRYALFDLVSDLPQPLLSEYHSTVAVEGGDGVLYFLTTGGIATVDPRLVERNAVPPPVVIRAMTADDRAWRTAGVVRLPALTRTIRIDYAALSLTIPERVRFRYRLEGWETSWHDAATRRTAFYTDLDPGDYTFHVVASNPDGVWNETGATVRFTILPAWYQTWAFTALVVAATGAAAATMYRRRVRRVSAALSARFDERLAERTRLARELHDTLLQTVQGSKLLADDALDRADDPEHVRSALERLSAWLGRAVVEGRAALNSLRTSTTEANDLAEAFRRTTDSPTKPTGLDASVTLRGGPRDLHPIVSDEIFRIGEEAIRNAFAHACATRLEVTLDYTHDLTLRVVDNGVGVGSAIAGAGGQGRFGLAGMRERAANIGATLTIDHASPGTTVALVVAGRTAFRSDTPSRSPRRGTSFL